MKLIKSLTLLLLLCTACNTDCKKSPEIIISKQYMADDYYNRNLPDCICLFKYSDKRCTYRTFQDSCHFYKINDTLK